MSPYVSPLHSSNKRNDKFENMLWLIEALGSERLTLNKMTSIFFFNVGKNIRERERKNTLKR
jgi:hypothetical protein